MDKKNGRTANGTTYLLERDKHTTQPTRCATKHELVALHLLEQGAQGVSALIRSLSTSIAAAESLASNAIGWQTVSKPISWWL